MKRRQLIAVSALCISVSGCLGEGVDEQGTDSSPAPRTTGSAKPRTETADTETTTPEGAVPGCWPDMCAGTGIAEVVVGSGVSGPVVLEVGCRSETRTLRPGESAHIEREEDGQACSITLSIDGEPIYDEEIEGYERVTVTVRENGEVETERVVY